MPTKYVAAFKSLAATNPMVRTAQQSSSTQIQSELSIVQMVIPAKTIVDAFNQFASMETIKLPNITQLQQLKM